ncbi:DNA helicase MCM9, partial [Araneus ventricosus]
MKVSSRYQLPVKWDESESLFVYITSWPVPKYCRDRIFTVK